MQGFAKDGGTFGVSAIVGECILANVRGIDPRFVKAHRHLLMLILREIDNPTNGASDLVAVALKFMRIHLDEDKAPQTEEERARVLYGLMRPLVEIFLLVLEEYSVLESHENQGWTLTAIGRRVMLHLFDAEKFIEHVAEVHKNLQQSGEAGVRGVVA
jgi:hypothetical protein